MPGRSVTIASIILVFVLLHRSHLEMSKVFKESNFTYPRCFAIRSPPEKPVHDRRPLSTVQTSLICAINSILEAKERNLLLPPL